MPEEAKQGGLMYKKHEKQEEYNHRLIGVSYMVDNEEPYDSVTEGIYIINRNFSIRTL